MLAPAPRCACRAVNPTEHGTEPASQARPVGLGVAGAVPVRKQTPHQARNAREMEHKRPRVRCQWRRQQRDNRAKDLAGGHKADQPRPLLRPSSDPTEYTHTLPILCTAPICNGYETEDRPPATPHLLRRKWTEGSAMPSPMPMPARTNSSIANDVCAAAGVNSVNSDHVSTAGQSEARRGGDSAAANQCRARACRHTAPTATRQALAW